MLVCRCYIIKKLRDAVTAVAVTVAAVAMTAARAPSTPSRAVASALVAYLGVARPQGASVGNKLSRGLSSERAHPGYYCLIDGQTNGSRPPSNNVVIKLSAGADKSVTDPTSAHGRGGSHRLRTAAHRLSYVLPPPFIHPCLALSRVSFLYPSVSLCPPPLSPFPPLPVVTGIKAMSRLHGRPAILYALMSAHVVACASGRALGSNTRISFGMPQANLTSYARSMLCANGL